MHSLASKFLARTGLFHQSSPATNTVRRLDGLTVGIDQGAGANDVGLPILRITRSKAGDYRIAKRVEVLDTKTAALNAEFVSLARMILRCVV